MINQKEVEVIKLNYNSKVILEYSFIKPLSNLSSLEIQGSVKAIKCRELNMLLDFPRINREYTAGMREFGHADIETRLIKIS